MRRRSSRPPADWRRRGSAGWPRGSRTSAFGSRDKPAGAGPRRTPQGHWSATPPLNEGLQISAIQPSILSVGGNRLLAVGRTRQGHLFQIASPDEGATWQPMTLLDVPNPNSGTDAVTLRDGRH